MSLQKPTLFTGTATALITPFSKGQIDFNAFGHLIDLQLAANIDALLVAGTTGESATLTTRELYELTAFAGNKLNVVNDCTNRDICKSKCVTGFNIGACT